MKGCARPARKTEGPSYCRAPLAVTGHEYPDQEEMESAPFRRQGRTR